MTIATNPRSEAHDSQTAPTGRQTQYVSFWLADQFLGVPVQMVQEVLNPQTIAPTPMARPEVAGLLNLRGQIVTAFNLRCRLGIAQSTTGAEPMNVVVRYQNESFSLLVDEVGDVISLSDDAIDPPPRTLDHRWRSVTRGVCRLEGQLMVVLDLGALLGFSEK